MSIQVKRNSFLMKIAYGWSSIDPNRTNVCALFWRTIFGALVFWPIIFPVLFCLAVVFLAVAYIGGFFVAQRPAILDSDKVTENGFTRYECWPTVAGLRVLPGVLVLLALAAYLLYKTGERLISTGYVGWVVLGGTSVLALVVLLAALYRTGVFALCKRYVADFKRRHCSIVDIVD